MPSPIPNSTSNSAAQNHDQNETPSPCRADPDLVSQKSGRLSVLLDEDPKRKKYILSAPGYRAFEWFLKDQRIETVPWSKMHDLDGEICELKAVASYSIWGLKSGLTQQDTYGQGLLLTDVDLDKVHEKELTLAPKWRIEKAKVQRSHYLSLCNRPDRIARLLEIENDGISGGNCLHPIVFAPLEEQLLKPIGNGTRERESTAAELYRFSSVTRTDFKDYGYSVRFSAKTRSRNELVTNGIYTKVGQYHRSVLCLAPMPDASGSLDAIATAAMCHMLSMIPRNFRFKDIGYQARFAKEVISWLGQYPMPDELRPFETKIRHIWQRNVCGLLGVGPDEVERFRKLLEAGVRSFRLYSVSTDVRIRDTAKLVIQEAKAARDRENPVELFIGQITSYEQLEDLATNLGMEDWGLVDGIFIGNGGGSRCKTAITGMLVDTPLLAYRLRNSSLMTGKSLIVEGGVSDELAVPLLLGASALSYAAGITGGCLESPGGALYICYDHEKEDYRKPYRGESSPSAKIIEGVLYPTGDTRHVEGANGFVRMEKKYPSMCGRIRTLNESIAQSLVKLGVDNLVQLHALGTFLTKAEVAQIYGCDCSEIPDLLQVVDFPSAESGEPRYVVPLPLFRRSLAQREGASAYGLADERNRTKR